MDTQNLSNEFQAGEFAQPSLLSPVATIETAPNGKLPKDDPLLNKAIACFFELELVNADSMTINSYFHTWGLGKTDLSQYSDYYQSTLNQNTATLGNDSVTNSNNEAAFMQTQCWICPHCHDDSYHQSDENGCEWQDKQKLCECGATISENADCCIACEDELNLIDAKRYRFLREVTFNQACCDGAVHVVFTKDRFDFTDYIHINGVDLDQAIDKAMAVSS